MSNIEYVSVSALNKYINYKFEQDLNLQEVYLKGEISNFKYSGKHCYFSIKDSFSEISAMFFYPSNLSLKFVPYLKTPFLVNYSNIKKILFLVSFYSHNKKEIFSF